MPRRRDPISARDYMMQIARALAAAGGEPAPAAIRVAFLTVYTRRVGMKVQVWFSRSAPRVPDQFRVGVLFDRGSREHNEQAGDAFAARHAAALRALQTERWPTETDNDRQYVTTLPVPPAGEDLKEVIERITSLARRYMELAKAD